MSDDKMDGGRQTKPPEISSPVTPISTVRKEQLKRFRRLFFWSTGGSVLVTAALIATIDNFWVGLSFFGLMLVMAGFLSAYYAMLRVES